MGKSQLKLGERGLSIILILFSIFAIIESYKISGTKLTSSSPGAFPIFISSMLLIFSIWILGEKRSLSQSKMEIKERLKALGNLIFTKDIVVVLILLIIYSVILELVGFTISTFLFLWIAISFLSSGKILRNLGVSILSVSIILLIFKTIFKVILP